MKCRLIGLAIGLLGAGCASSEQECLPGDIDCAPAGGGDGKADGFDYKNDPVRMSSHLQYRLSELPQKGFRDKAFWADQYPDAVGHAQTIWADTYWPTSEGSHNNRWQGASVKSPLEKYDAAYNNAAGCETYPSKFCGDGAAAEWNTYYTCAGPAAKWQSQEFQGGGDMHDGRDNNGDGKVDECFGSNDADGIAGWWGTCHAWTPASQLFPEPQHEVTVNGVTFAVGDIKALLQNMCDSTDAVMLGGRCNSKEIHHDVHGSANDACRDVNPGALHVVMTNYLGITKLPLIEDRTANFEVWNQPVAGYEVTKQTKVSAKDAMKCVGASGDSWTYNDNAKELYEVQMTVQYVREGYASTTPLGFMNNIATDDYHYILELNGDGKIIGGRFCTDSEDSGIDFLWAPTGMNACSPSNPNVDAAKVKELLAKSVAVDDGGGGGTGHTFTASPAAHIPDNDPAGVSVDVPVTGLSGAQSLAVSVDISHTYRGDLVVDLLHDGALVKNLTTNTGGSQHDITETYTVSASAVGASPNGTWTLHVVDTAAQDDGTVNKVTLTFTGT